MTKADSSSAMQCLTKEVGSKSAVNLPREDTQEREVNSSMSVIAIYLWLLSKPV